MSLFRASDDRGAVPVADAALEALGIVRLPVPVPFIEAGGPANIYAIADEGPTYTLFDTGVGTPEGTAALKAGLKAHGIAVEAISRIVISHGHIDHYGNAQWLSEVSGAKVYIHAADREKIATDLRWNEVLVKHWDYFTALGVPTSELDAIVDRTSKAPRYARPVEVSRLSSLEEGQTFAFRHFEAQVLHTPGHTPGLVCLYAKGPKVLFADDHVLARVSPNPLIDLSQGEGPTKFRALVSYLLAARRVRELELDAVLPGHGEAFSNHQTLLDDLFSFYARRQERLLRAVTKAPASVYDLAEVMFMRRDNARLFLMLSEVLGNLEVLEDDAQVRKELVDGVWRYAPC